MYPSASAAISIKFDPLFGRHVVANRDIEVGEVIFNEDPIVTYFSTAGEDTVATPACQHCFLFIRSGLVPCPTCSTACFCRFVCTYIKEFHFSHGKNYFTTHSFLLHMHIVCKSPKMSHS